MTSPTFRVRAQMPIRTALSRSRTSQGLGLSRIAAMIASGSVFLGTAGLAIGCQDEGDVEVGEVDLIEFVDFGPPQIEAGADEILHKMSDYLAATKAFTFRVDITNDVMLSSGQVVQIGGTSDISVQRPGQARAFYNGDERQTRTYVNNGTLTIYNVRSEMYAVAEVPVGLDAAVDFIFERLGFSVPIADLLYEDPYATLTESVWTGHVVGEHTIGSTPCTHLAFSQETIDWEIWIASGSVPVPLKILIRYKDEQGSPQYSAALSEWNLKPNLSSNYFEFSVPAGVDLIEFLPIPEPTP